MLKKITMFTIICFTVFFGYKDVYSACEYQFDMTKYKFDDNYNVHVDFKETKKIIITSVEGGVKGKCEDYDPNSWKSEIRCYLLDDRANSSLFVMEDQKLFCPSQIYINSEDGYNNFISLAKDPKKTKKISLNNDGFMKKVEVPGFAVGILDEKALTSGYYVYDNSKKNSDDSLNSCKKGGSAEVSNYKNFYNMQKNSLNAIEDAEGVGDKLTEFLNNIDVEKDRNGNTKVYKVDDLASYCYYYTDEGKAGIDEFQKIKEEIVVEANKKISTYKNLSQSEKTDLYNNIDSIEIEYSGLDFSGKLNNKTYNCDSLLDDDLKAVIQLILKWVRIAAPILLIILVAVDFSQAVLSNDQDAIKKAISKAIKRAIAALALFFIPYLVSQIINWVDPTMYFNPETAKCEEVLK